MTPQAVAAAFAPLHFAPRWGRKRPPAGVLDPFANMGTAPLLAAGEM